MKLRAKPEFMKYLCERGLTQTMAADVVGVSRPTMKKIVHGGTISPITAHMICDTLGINMWDYFELVGGE